MIRSSTKPFLRWAGGKTWLVGRLRPLLLATRFRAYYEPFLGSGAVFFSGATAGHTCHLSDTNTDLIGAFLALRDAPGDVIDLLRGYENDEAFYYEVRSTVPRDPVARAARFIYLNQTSFNGIYRVNLRGEYNVPYGFRDKEFLDVETLRACSSRLRGVDLRVADFDWVVDHAKKGDLVFLDPPYTVSHNLNGFIKYNEKLFSLGDQHRLSELVTRLRSRGAYYILTNAAHAKVKEIFDRGDRCLEVYRQSQVGGASAKRGRVAEYVFTNVPGEF